jgi:hypothetical protein
MARDLKAVGTTEVLERGTLSDHAPLRITLEPTRRPARPA